MSSQQMKNSVIKEEARKWQMRNAYSALDYYAKENVMFGRIKNGDKIPFDVYIDEIGLQDIAPLLDCERANSSILNRGVIDYKDIENIYEEIGFNKIGIVLHYTFAFGVDKFNALSNGLFVMFKEIMHTKINNIAAPDFTDSQELLANINKAIKFVNAIDVRKLKQDRCIDRYLKDMQYISPFILRLVEKKKGRYFLKNNDTFSFNYKLAVLSCLPFLNPNNVKLFELKMQYWEKLNNNH